jgi:glutamate synthase domain-containing protein 1
MGFPNRISSRQNYIPQESAAPKRVPASLPSYIQSSLIDPRFDLDSCGVGFVAQLSAEPSHQVLQYALTALARLEHRGAVAADGKSSDGVGVTTAIPREWLLSQCGLWLDESSPLGVAVLFLPKDDTRQRTEIDSALFEQDMEVLAWRSVPICPEILGEIADSSRPEIWHLLITCDDAEFFNRRLFLARKQFERSGLPGYIVGISSETMIYKALCAGRLLSEFYPDLADSEFKTPLALFHQRYATNVLPSWERAQPFCCLAHNGESTPHGAIAHAWKPEPRLYPSTCTLSSRRVAPTQPRSMRSSSFSPTTAAPLARQCAW